MDPLGARPQVVDIGDVLRWGAVQPETPPPISPVDKTPTHVISPFPVREDLNDKVALWNGDMTLLRVEAVVNPSNETLTDKNPISLRLFEAAGPELREECKTQIITCRTGEAKISGAYSLPARHVIHTVGPRFNLRYKTAAESALYNCYRSVMQLIRSRHLASVAFSTLNSSRRGYPPEEGAHIAIRTIRRFLEHYGEEIDLVVFANDTTESVYNKVMPLYFPRNAEEEEYATKALPEDIGNEVGEPVIAERMIRIADNPVLQSMSDPGNGIHLRERDEREDGEEEEDVEKDSKLLSEVGSHPFSVMTADHDKERQDQITRSRPLTEEEAQVRQYQLYLRRARTENFADIAGLGALYKAGRDYMGRQVVVYVGRLLPAPKVDLSKAIAYFVHTMELVVNRDYVLVYFHSQSVSENQPDSSFFKQIYNMVDPKYKRNLRALYIVHPTWWFKLSVWWFLTFTASDLKEKVCYLNGVQYLYDTIRPDQIEIPEFVLEFDKEINGTNYYTPSTPGEEGTGGGL